MNLYVGIKYFELVTPSPAQHYPKSTDSYFDIRDSDAPTENRGSVCCNDVGDISYTYKGISYSDDVLGSQILVTHVGDYVNINDAVWSEAGPIEQTV